MKVCYNIIENGAFLRHDRERNRAMAIIHDWGKLSTGEPAKKYTITCGRMTAVVSDLGASLIELWLDGKDGVKRDIVWGFDDPITYETDNTPHLGATIGRNANRTGNAVAMIGDECFTLDKNQDEHNLHSGPNGFNKRLWQLGEHDESSVCFVLHSPDGDQGFPGNADITVRYSLENGDSLKISYKAKADKDTVFNLTNHSYFNLDGEESETVLDHFVKINAKYYTETSAESIPTGKIVPVEGTPMDFREGKQLGRDIEEPYDQLVMAGGFDHNFCIKPEANSEMILAAVLKSEKSGITMETWTDLPGVQLYCGNYLKGELGKRGKHYGKRSAVCFETQFWPDCTKHADFPKSIVPANTEFSTETVYKFDF